MKTWIVVDAYNLAYRMFHAMGDLSFGDRPTGVVFGFLREIVNLQDQFQTSRIVFCFDLGEPRRRVIYPAYKLKRHTKHRTAPIEERTARQHMHAQIDALRCEYLPQMGYVNVLAQMGYEGDDLIASVVTNDNYRTDDFIIISSDDDLLQLLSPRVSVYSPSRRRISTSESFFKEWGIKPHRWAVVKSIAGCKTDEIAGVVGCREKTAAKFLLRQLSEGSKAYQAITSDLGREIRRINRRVVELPLSGTDVFNLGEDKVSVEGWRKVCSGLGMESLMEMSPLSSRGARRENSKHLRRP